VPQTNPRYGHQPDPGSADAFHNGEGREIESLEFESPLYDYLETNIPKPLMAYSDKAFPGDSPLFPSHQEVLKYLKDYAEEVKHLIHFNHQVRNVTLDESSTDRHEAWKIEVEDLLSSAITTGLYNAVVVANGHYTVPSIPRIAGIEAWNTAYPGSIIHSKGYRRPEDYVGQKVLVIGNSASGLDIAFQVSQQCKQPVLLSSRSVSAFGTMPASSWRKDVDEVVELLPASQGTRAVRLRSGDIEASIDTVIFATGYFYSFPFLSEIKPPVVTDGLRTQDVYQHLFHIDHSSLVFPVINLKVIPFPLAENQAAVVARVWSGRLQLPSKEKMREWERETIKQKGNGKYFHLKKFPEDAAQINELHQWARSASTMSGLENDGQGKLGTGWNERQVWMRSKFPEIKGAYNGRGDQRVHVKTLEELGFDFDKWRQSARPEDLEMFEAGKCQH
jgi:cation diffusion facilitator CzcD-associated flavoprotein CzcO